MLAALFEANSNALEEIIKQPFCLSLKPDFQTVASYSIIWFCSSTLRTFKHFIFLKLIDYVHYCLMMRDGACLISWEAWDAKFQHYETQNVYLKVFNVSNTQCKKKKKTKIKHVQQYAIGQKSTALRSGLKFISNLWESYKVRHRVEKLCIVEIIPL